MDGIEQPHSHLRQHRHAAKADGEHKNDWRAVLDHCRLDGKLAYVSSGDVIDMKSRKIVAQLKDEYGRTMHSEKVLDMVFVEGKLTRVANQFGNGLSHVSASENTSSVSAR